MTTDATMRMPWGKYHGQALTEVPGSYLAYLLEKGDDIPQDLREAIQHALMERFAPDSYWQQAEALREALEARHEAKHRGPIRCRRCSAIQERLRDWFRGWVLKLHPDRGGTAESMALLNTLHDELQRSLVPTEARR